MFSKNAILLGLLALIGATAARSKPSTFTEFIGRGKPGAKGQEQIGPIADWECISNGAFAHPDSCELYVDCWETQAILYRCTEDMLFDLRYSGCEFAQYVDCQERPRPTDVPGTLTPPPSTTTTNYSTTTTPAPDSNFTCPEPDAVYAHEEKCEYYWICAGNVPNLHHCQLDYLFDLVYMGCNFAHLTHCQDRERPGHYPGTSIAPISTTSTTSGPTTTAGPTTPEVSTESPDPNLTTTAGPTTLKTTTEGGGEFVCPSDGFFADPNNCSWFYHCAFGEPIHQQCPGELYFNPIVDACDFPENVDCKNRKRSKLSHH